ncbi:hypothetical protein AB0O91_01025 [Kitasatospora sp. NPDC089797]|uniref:hypothetical protein n=1 Tax=Kitasatospora sp. NPDC089797 TaxID=3155298 RepID=UPI003444F5D9
MAAPEAHERIRRLQNAETALRLTAATGLLLDAAVHLRLAHHYGAATVSQGVLVRGEAAAATLAMALVLVWRRHAGDLYALAVCAAGLAVLLLHGHGGTGILGPLPDTGGQLLRFTATTLTACCQAVAAAALVALVAGHHRYLP